MAKASEDRRREQIEGPAGEARAIKLRAQRHDGWTPERQDLFFGALALTANVSSSCKLVDMDPTGAYRRRANDPLFRRRWDEALADGHDELHRAMLERALVAEAHARAALAGSDEDARALAILRAFPDRVAEILFRAHAAHRRDIAEDDEIENDEDALARIEARLDALRVARANEAAQPETSA